MHHRVNYYDTEFFINHVFLHVFIHYFYKALHTKFFKFRLCTIIGEVFVNAGLNVDAKNNEKVNTLV